MRNCPLDLPRFGSGTALHRILTASRELDIDLSAFSGKSIVITGTNGKGSVARILANLAWHHGKSTGLFTSPHILEFNERFNVNGSPVDDALLNESAGAVSGAIQRYQSRYPGEQFGAFEAWLLQALLMFQQQQLEFCVFEAGIGGRFDPTRVIKPEIACLTSIDLEHTEILGSSEAQIFFDKFDIAPAGSTLILGSGLERFEKEASTMAQLKDIQLLWTDQAFSSISARPQNGINQIELVWQQGRSDRFETRLIGQFATNNLALACLAYARHIGQPAWEANQRRTRQAMATVTCPGRFEYIEGDPPFLIDFAHTPKAIAGTLADIEAIHGARRKIFLVGCSSNRPGTGFIEQLASANNEFVIAQGPRGLAADVLEGLIRQANPSAQTSTHGSPAAACERAIGMASEEDGLICVLGGLFWGASIRALVTQQ